MFRALRFGFRASHVFWETWDSGPGAKKRCRHKPGRSIIGLGREVYQSVDIEYGDPMVLAGKFIGVISSVFIFVMLAVAGCQGQRAEAPAMKLGPAGSTRVGGEHPRSSEEVVRGRTTHEEPPEGVTPNEAKRVPAEAGKLEPSGPAVELALKFVPGRATTYRITTELEKSVEWKGAQAARPAQFTDGRTGNHIELTFEQRVQQVQGDGSAVLEIAIKGLKYVGEVVNKTVLDFDSARQEDSGSPLAALVGKSYRVKMSPQGQVLEISNVEPLRQAVQGGLPAHRVAQRLLSDDEIRSRHEITALSALKEGSTRPGQNWSSIRTFSFDDLGAKTYERIYTLKQVPTEKGGPAVVEMRAIPSAARAEEMHKGQAVNPFAKMSDNSDRYEGRLVLDLDSGQVREYSEQMQNEWIIADPAAVQTGRPTAIKMAAKRLQRLELVP